LGTHKRTLSSISFRFIAILALLTLCLSLVSGCQQTNPPSSGVTATKHSSSYKIVYAINGVVYETDLSGAENRKIFSSRQNSPWELFEYFPERQVFIYTVLNQEHEPQERVLREYSLKDKKDKKIDSIEFLLSSVDENRVLYTKSTKSTKSQDNTEDRSVFVTPNSLFLYNPGKGIKSLHIQNVSNAVIDTETAELCYTSFMPVKQMTQPASKMYIAKLDNIEPQLIASFPEGAWAAPVSFSKEHIIYMQGEPNTGADDASLYLFDRKTKQTRLIEDKALFLAVDKEKKTLAVAKKDSDSLKDFSIWELQYEEGVKTKLFHLSLRDERYGSFKAKYSPDGKYIILKGWDGSLGLYDFSTKRYRVLFDEKEESIRDFIFTPDGKNIICTIGKPPYASSISKDVIYKIELKSGESAPIVKSSKDEAEIESGKYTPTINLSEDDSHEIIKLIGVY